jgi:hypothetical protein
MSNTTTSNDPYDPIFILDIIHAGILPISLIIATFLSMSSAVIFSLNEFKPNQIYKYLKANAILDSTLLIIILITTPFVCDKLFPSLTINGENELDSFTRSFILRIVKMSSGLINLIITLQRYLSLNGSTIFTRQQSFNIIISTIIIVSIIYNIPNMILKFEFNSNKQSQKTNETVNSLSIFFKTNLPIIIPKDFKKVVAVMQYMIHIFPSTLTAIFNALLVYKLKSNLKSSRQINRNLWVPIKNGKSNELSFQTNFSKQRSSSTDFNVKKKERKIVYERMYTTKLQNMSLKLTLMIIWLSTVFIVNEIVFIGAYTAYIYGDINSLKGRFNFFIIRVGYTICALLNVWIYYKFNPLFAFRFKRLMLSIRNLGSILKRCCCTRPSFLRRKIIRSNRQFNNVYA